MLTQRLRSSMIISIFIQVLLMNANICPEDVDEFSGTLSNGFCEL